VCGGRAMCGRCQIDVGVGEFAKHGILSSAEALKNVTCHRAAGLPASVSLSLIL
jgi:uncharacterized 2Fe-2S/4Fe-4S cluster protein (DUF4445 family)